MSILWHFTDDLSTVEKLVAFIGEIDNLKRLRWNDPKVDAWKNKVLRFLKRELEKALTTIRNSKRLSMVLLW